MMEVHNAIIQTVIEKVTNSERNSTEEAANEFEHNEKWVQENWNRLKNFGFRIFSLQN